VGLIPRGGSNPLSRTTYVKCENAVCWYCLSICAGFAMTRTSRIKVHKYQRNRIWWVRFWKDGREYRKSLKVTDEDMAEIARHSTENLLRRGKLLPQKRRPADDIKDILSTYLEGLQGDLSDRTIQSYRDSMKGFLAFANVERLHEVTANLIERFRRKRLKTKAPKTVKNDLTTLSAFFRYCMRQGYLDTNPMNGVTRIRRIQQKLPRFLSDQEVERVFENAKDELEIISGLGIYAGLRRGEMLRLRWDDIDFQHKVIYIKKAKGKKVRSVPLNSTLAGILAKYKKTSGPLLRNMTERRLSQVYTDFLKKIDVPDASLHTLRHTFASRLAQKGVSIYKVSKWLGHSSVVVTNIYAHLSPQDEDIDVL